MRGWILIAVVLAACSKQPARDSGRSPLAAGAEDAGLAAPDANDADLAEGGECTRDDDCVVTTFTSCCACCRCGQPRAALRATTAERRDDCEHKHCKPRSCPQLCASCAFPFTQDQPGKCAGGTCVMP